MAHSTFLVASDLHDLSTQILDKGREMATVTARFKDNYEFWSAYKVATGEFTQDEIDGLKVMIRRDLTKGPDQLREGLEVINLAGVTVPATIDDHEERYQLWEQFFAEECEAIRFQPSAGINDRIRSSLSQAKSEMGVAA